MVLKSFVIALVFCFLFVHSVQAETVIQRFQVNITEDVIPKTVAQKEKTSDRELSEKQKEEKHLKKEEGRKKEFK